MLRTKYTKVIGRDWEPEKAGKPEFLCNHLILMLLVISNLTFLSLWALGTKSECIRPQLVYSPAAADGAIEYQRRRLSRDIQDNVYTGEPRPEHDAAWVKLIERNYHAQALHQTCADVFQQSLSGSLSLSFRRSTPPLWL